MGTEPMAGETGEIVVGRGGTDDGVGGPDDHHVTLAIERQIEAPRGIGPP